MTIIDDSWMNWYGKLDINRVGIDRQPITVSDPTIRPDKSRLATQQYDMLLQDYHKLGSCFIELLLKYEEKCKELAKLKENK